MADENLNVTDNTEVVDDATEQVDENTEPEKEERTFTQEEVNKFLSDRLSREVRKIQRQLKAEQDAKIEAEKQAEKLKNMTKEAKDAEDMKALRDELAQLRKEREVSEMTATARARLKDMYGYTFSDGLISHLIADTAEETADNIDEVVELVRAEVQAEVSKRMAGVAPQNPNTGKAVTPQTPDEIMEEVLKIKDPEERTRKMLQNRSILGF